MIEIWMGLKETTNLSLIEINNLINDIRHLSNNNKLKVNRIFKKQGYTGLVNYRDELATTNDRPLVSRL